MFFSRSAVKAALQFQYQQYANNVEEFVEDYWERVAKAGVSNRPELLIGSSEPAADHNPALTSAAKQLSNAPSPLELQVSNLSQDFLSLGSTFALRSTFGFKLLLQHFNLRSLLTRITPAF